MDRRTLGSIGLLLAGAGLYALVDVVRPRASAPDPTSSAPQAPTAEAPAAPPPAPVAPAPPPPPRAAAPAPSPGLAGTAPPPISSPPVTPPHVAPPPVVPPPVAPPPIAPTVPPPAAPPPTVVEPPPAAPSPATRRLLELILEMRIETLRIHRVLHVTGRVTQDSVDDAELAVVDARHDLAELTEAAWHRARAEILARRADSVASEVVVGHLPQDAVDLARLDVARERALAGDPSDYATTRDAVLARSATSRQRLIEAGRLSAAEATAAGLALERRFPALGGAAPALR